MKRLISLAAIIFATGLLFTSCTEEGIGTNPEDFSSISTESLFIDNTISEEATLTTDVTIDADMEYVAEEPPVKFSPPQRPPKKGHYIPLGRVFREMELTSEQADSVKKYMRMMHECEWAIKRQLFEDTKPFMDSINQERRILIQQVKDGEISREEAKELIMALNQSAREYLATYREEAIELLINCKELFNERIASILTDEQLEIWNDFLERLQERMG